MLAEADSDCSTDTIQSSDAVAKCAEGAALRIVPAVERINARMTSLCDRQIELIDKVAVENDRFSLGDAGGKLGGMLEKTRHYHAKLISIKKDMALLSERSASLRLRAGRLQEAKQKEALKREQKRQKSLEREEQLVARPAESKQ